MKQLKYKRGIAVVTYNRAKVLPKVLDAIIKTQPEGCRLVICDDGSTDDTFEVASNYPQFVYIGGKNKGVVANKNRALFALQDCEFLAIIEDDLIPTKCEWFNMYEEAAIASGVNHFCRVQDKEVPEVLEEFHQFMTNNGLTPIYGPSPRGDFTFITSKVTKVVGAFNPEFMGVGCGHGEWSDRVCKAGLVGHPNKWVDIKEARDSFIQQGDTDGGRWDLDQDEIKKQIKKNKEIRKRLEGTDYTHYPLILY